MSVKIGKISDLTISNDIHSSNDDVVPMDTTDDCDEYYEYEILSKSQEVIKQKSTRKKAIPKVIREKVWRTYMGDHSGKGKCFCCNHTELTSFQFECGHVISEYNGGDVNIENLRPICSLCNKSMGKINMIDYMTKNKLPFPKNWNGFNKANVKKEIIVID